MKVVLVNDTSNNEHYGCFAVSNAIRRELHKRDGVEILPIFNRQLKFTAGQAGLDPAQDEALLHAMDWADLVVVNGEGTLHHGRAPELERVLEIANDAKKPYFVINTIFEDYKSLGPLLSEAAGVSVRDNDSLAEVQALGVHGQRCLDAAFFANFEAFADKPVQRSAKAYTDWHPEAHTEAFNFIKRLVGVHDTVFMPFIAPDAAAVWQSVPRQIASFQQIVCGRYHAAIFAILAKTPFIMLRSNSRKMSALAKEMLGSEAGLEQGIVQHVAGQALEDAHQHVMDARAIGHLHPLRVISLGTKVHRVSLPRQEWSASLFVREPKPIERARHLADEISHLPKKPPPKIRRMLTVRLSSEPALDRQIAADFLLQENMAAAAAQIASSLIGMTEAKHVALKILMSSFNLAPDNTSVAIALAHAYTVFENPHVALGLYIKVAERGELRGQSAIHAARCAARVGDFASQRRFHLLLQPDEADRIPLEIASAASRLGLADVAVYHGRKAAENWQDKSTREVGAAGNLLVSNGEHDLGWLLLSHHLRQTDESLRSVRKPAWKDGSGTIIHFSNLAGVGSATLCLGYLAGMTDEFKQPLSIIIDPRLHHQVRNILGDNVVCHGTLDDAIVRGTSEVLDMFEFMRLARTDSGNALGRFLSTSESHRPQLRHRLQSSFGGRTLCGIAWWTPNARTTSGRSLTREEIALVIRRNPAVQFVSLQPDNAFARAEIERVGAENFCCVDDIDPQASIDDQLKLIEALDHVISIDCSSALFAGALGKSGKVLLRGEPTWQWPLRQSRFGSLETVAEFEQWFAGLS